MQETNFNKMYKDLKTWRDELRLQANLFEMEYRDDWQDLEEKWERFGQAIDKIQADTKGFSNQVSQTLSSTTEHLANEINDGYQRIKNHIHQHAGTSGKPSDKSY